METMINLNDLLKHEILDLYSAEEQIIEAMPAMIEKAKNPELKKALQQHLKITEEQKSRLDKVKATFGEGEESGGENKGFFSRLFGGNGGGSEKCRGMEGLITEGEKIMSADITDEALDAAIIASAQKIEHYEICGYGTARAFARELKLQEVERLLTQTLNEEYEADDKLTALAVGKLNEEAERANGIVIGEGRGGSNRSGRNGSNGSRTKTSSGGSKNSSKGASSKSSGKKSGGVNSSRSAGKSSGGSKSASKGGGSKGGSKTTSGGRSGKGGSAKGGTSKSGSSKGSSKSSKSAGKSASKGSSKGGSKASKGGSKGSKSSKGSKGKR